MDPKERRRKRRQLTRKIAQRRRAIHLAAVHPDGALDCACELADTYFAARSPRGCGCRKRRRVRPREGTGICHIDARRHVYRARQQGRMLRDLIVAQRAELDDDVVTCARHPAAQ